MPALHCARHFLLAGAVIACSAASACAQEFYRGKTINFTIGFSVNNGYDSYSRVLARYIGKHLPGNPNVVVQNMPGAVSLAAISYLYNSAPKDGTVLGMIDQASALTQVLDPGAMRADVSKFNWIGRLTDNAAVLYSWHTAPVQKMSDALAKELIVATNGQSSRQLASLLKNLLGYKLKTVNGYAGTNEAALAMERGEIHALTQPWTVLRAERPEWLRERKINLLLQVGVDQHAELQGVPLITNLARTAEDRRIIEFIAGNSRVGRSVVSPPGQPPQRVAELRAAFMQTMQDEAFRAEVARLNLDLAPLDGEALQKIIADSLSVPPELVEKGRAFAEAK